MSFGHNILRTPAGTAANFVFNPILGLIKKAGKKGEFLTPLTLAEVLSYTERERHLAQEKLEVLIKEFGLVQNLDGNQQALQQRAYLILGNLEFLDRRYDEARGRYDDVLKINEHNAYAILSKAQVAAINNPENKIGLYQQGLTALEKTGAINKHEITGRVLALAWAIIAAHEIGDHREEKYWNEFEKDSKDIRKVADREPMFFCPIAKTLVKFEELRKTLCFQTGRKEP